MHLAVPFIALLAFTQLLNNITADEKNDDGEEEEIVESFAGCSSDIPPCPVGKKPYSVYYNHSDGFETRVYPNIYPDPSEPEKPDDGLYGSEHHFLTLRQDRNWEDNKQDIFELSVNKKKRPVDFRRICFRTFSAISVDIEIFKKQGNKDVIFKDYVVETVKGGSWFRSVRSPDDKLIEDISKISLLIFSKAPTYNIKEVVLLACVPGKKKKNKDEKDEKEKAKKEKDPQENRKKNKAMEKKGNEEQAPEKKSNRKKNKKYKNN